MGRRRAESSASTSGAPVDEGPIDEGAANDYIQARVLRRPTYSCDTPDNARRGRDPRQHVPWRKCQDAGHRGAAEHCFCFPSLEFVHAD
jgi:hypothetical protein